MYHEIARYLLEIEGDATKPITSASNPSKKTSSPTTSASKPIVSKPKVVKPEEPKKVKAGSWVESEYKKIIENKDLRSKYVNVLRGILGPKYYDDLHANNGNYILIAIKILSFANKFDPTHRSATKIYDDLVSHIKDKFNNEKEHTALIKYVIDPKTDVEVVDDGEKGDIEVVAKREVISWDTYSNFRKKMYAETVRLGWPSKIASPKDSDFGTVLSVDSLWKESKSQNPFLFNGWNPAIMKTTSDNIRAYLMDKFKNNPNGLSKLSSKVENILDLEKKELKSKTKVVFNIFGSLAMFVFKGLGGSERDLAFFNWIKGKFGSMTIFEYQQAIIADVRSRLSITDTSGTVLKNMLSSMHKSVTEACRHINGGIVENIKYGQSYDGDTYAYFYVRPKQRATESKSVVDLMLGLMQGFDEKKENDAYKENGVIINFVRSARKSPVFTSGPSEESIVSLCELGRKHNSTKAFLEKFDRKPMTFLLDSKNEHGEVVGQYKWEIALITKYVEFRLTYEPEE